MLGGNKGEGRRERKGGRGREGRKVCGGRKGGGRDGGEYARKGGRWAKQFKTHTSCSSSHQPIWKLLQAYQLGGGQRYQILLHVAQVKNPQPCENSTRIGKPGPCAINTLIRERIARE